MDDSRAEGMFEDETTHLLPKEESPPVDNPEVHTNSPGDTEYAMTKRSKVTVVTEATSVFVDSNVEGQKEHSLHQRIIPIALRLIVEARAKPRSNGSIVTNSMFTAKSRSTSRTGKGTRGTKDGFQHRKDTS